jgi:hypothetical protein
MLEPVGEALGPRGSLLGQAGGHRAGDGEELGLDHPPDPAGSLPDQGFQARDRALEPADRVTPDALPELSEVHDLGHDAIVDPGSDTPVEARPNFSRRSEREHHPVVRWSIRRVGSQPSRSESAGTGMVRVRLHR